jgi:hypothetical protein
VAQTDYEVCAKSAESYLSEFSIIFKLAKPIFWPLQPIFRFAADYLPATSFRLRIVNLSHFCGLSVLSIWNFH